MVEEGSHTHETDPEEEVRKPSYHSTSCRYNAQTEEDLLNLNGIPPGPRSKIALLLSHQWCETLVGAIILFNMYVVIADTDYRSLNPGSGSPWWTEIANISLLVFYVVELALRFYAYRWKFFKNGWNNLDLSIISVDVLSLTLGSLIAMPKMAFLRIVRLMKLVRAVRILLAFPELYMLVKGLIGAMKAILWGAFLIVVILTLYGIIAVELIHPINVRVHERGVYVHCERCSRAFSTVPSSIVTLTQTIVAGDSWGQVSIPILEEEPWAYLFFLATYFTVGMGVTNLILAVIVDKAHESRQDDLKQMAKMKENDAVAAKKRLEKICAEMDKDGSGSMSLDEIMDGYDEVPEFADLLRVMDINREDLSMVFSILDQDGSGDIDYEEFAEQLYKMKSHDVHTLIVFVKYYVIQILNETRQGFRWLGKNERGSRSSPLEDKRVSLGLLGDSPTTVEKATTAPLPAVGAAQEHAALPAAGTETKEDLPEVKMNVEGKRANSFSEISEELRRLNAANEELARTMQEIARRVDANSSAVFRPAAATDVVPQQDPSRCSACGASSHHGGSFLPVVARSPLSPTSTRSVWGCCTTAESSSLKERCLTQDPTLASS